MSLLSVLKKIGATLVWPFTHAQMLAHLFDRISRDVQEADTVLPEVKTLTVGLVEQFEAVGADTISAVAAKGLDFEADAKEVEAIKSLFSYFETKFAPAVKQIFTDLKMADAGTSEDPTATDPASSPAASTEATQPAPAAAQSGPGLHNVVPA